MKTAPALSVSFVRRIPRTPADFHSLLIGQNGVTWQPPASREAGKKVSYWSWKNKIAVLLARKQASCDEAGRRIKGVGVRRRVGHWVGNQQRVS